MQPKIMGNFALVSVLLLTQLAFKGLCQATGSCPGTMNSTTEKSFPVSQGICNILFKAEKNKHVQLNFPAYNETEPNYVFVFDGPSCLAERFDIVNDYYFSYKSTAEEMTMLSSYEVTSPPAVAFQMQYSTDQPPVPARNNQPPVPARNISGDFIKPEKNRTCGEPLTGDSGELRAISKSSTGTGPHFCIWTIATASNQPTKLTVTEFNEEVAGNQLWIFDGTDCSGKNLLWFKTFDNRKNTVTSKTGKFVLMSFGISGNQPFVAKWEKDTGTTIKQSKPTEESKPTRDSSKQTTSSKVSTGESKPTEATTPDSSVRIKGNAFWWLFLVGAVHYLRSFLLE